MSSHPPLGSLAPRQAYAQTAVSPLLQAVKTARMALTLETQHLAELTSADQEPRIASLVLQVSSRRVMTSVQIAQTVQIPGVRHQVEVLSAAQAQHIVLRAPKVSSRLETISVQTVSMVQTRGTMLLVAVL